MKFLIFIVIIVIFIFHLIFLVVFSFFILSFFDIIIIIVIRGQNPSKIQNYHMEQVEETYYDRCNCRNCTSFFSGSFFLSSFLSSSFSSGSFFLSSFLSSSFPLLLSSSSSVTKTHQK